MGGQTPRDGSYLAGPLGWARRGVVPAEHPNAAHTVAAWFMHLPGQGIGWNDYLLSVIDLRPPAHRRYPQAEYELMVCSLFPDRGPRWDDVETWVPMTPLNVVEQFHGVSREQAGEVARACAAGCVTGRLAAETQLYVHPGDGSEPRMMTIVVLAEAWRDAVAKTVEHIRTGGFHERLN